MNVMPKSATEAQPIIISEVVFRVNRLILDTEEEINLKAYAQLRVKRMKVMARPTFVIIMQAYFQWPEGDDLDLRDTIANGDAKVRQVCYQIHHTPTDMISPIFDHTFKPRFMSVIGGIPQVIGKMKPYPANRVWPELTSQGWYGVLPQFYE